MAEDKAEDSWGSLIYTFTQETTFHGIRYITLPSQYISRRVIWTLCTLGATSVFLYFVIMQLIHLLDRPKAVDVEIIFNSSLTFPSVTICNQNLFRLTKAQQYGLYDTIEEAFSKSHATNAANNKEDITTGFTSYYNYSMSSVPDGISANTIYGATTANGCLNICLHLHGDTCCSTVFNRLTRKCFISPQMPDVGGVKRIYDNSSIFFHRKKCQLDFNATCDFEVDACNFVVDEAAPLQWKIVKANESTPDNWRPDTDYTSSRSSGSYLLAETALPRKNKALLISPYLISTKESCLILHHQIRFGQIVVSTGVEKNDITEVWRRIRTVSIDWETAYIKLPVGQRRIYIEARSIPETTTSAVPLILVAIDDVYIGRCDPAPECRLSPLSLSYGGSQNITAQGNPCVAWKNIPQPLRSKKWQFSTSSLTRVGSTCQNPDDDVNGPWCYVSTDTYRVEYCNISYCDCRENQTACHNGRCISDDYICDSIADCEHGEDEDNCPAFPSAVSCDFTNHNCSYGNSEPSVLQWSHVIPSHYMKLVGRNARPGDIGSLITPSTLLLDTGCLKMTIYHQGIEPFSLDVYKVALNNTFIKHHLCSLFHKNVLEQSNYTFLMETTVPAGEYHLMFSVVIASTQDVTRILNVTLAGGACLHESVGTTDPSVRSSTRNFRMTSHPDEFQANEQETTEDLWDDFVSVTASSFTTVEDQPFDDFPPTCNNQSECSTCRKLIEMELNINQSKLTYIETLREDMEGTLNCNFDNDTCGYSFESSNLKWIAYRKEIVSEEDTIAEVPLNRYMLTIALQSEDTTDRGEEWLRLYSPIVDVDRESCLTFYYYNRFVDIAIYEYTDNSINYLATIDRDGPTATWQRAMFDVTSGRKGLLYQLKHYEWRNKNFAMDNIQLTDGSCTEMVANTAGYTPSINCTFDDGYWCGYRDYSPKVKVFYRSARTERDVVTYYARVAYSSAKLSRRLASPVFTASDESCLVFRYFSSGLSSGDIKAVTVNLLDEAVGRNNETMIWRVFGPMDFTWGWAQADVPPGTYRAIFEIDGGDGTLGGFDDITLLPGRCHNESLPSCDPPSMFLCDSHIACIPPSSKCNANWNCDTGEDELHADCSDFTIQPTPSPAINVSREVDDEDEYEDLSDSEERDADNRDTNLSLIEMYGYLGHNHTNFIYSCEWQDIPCSYSNFTTEITDMGLCHTFNHDGSFELAETGSRYGLRVMLNIEQYQYMRGPNNDAGIKVYLHHAGESARIRDLGFAISPGQHALIGVSLSDAESLRKPWGDCEDKDLLYYDEYNFANCELECETKALVDKCNCRDGYMPGNSTDDPPYCDVSQFFQCVVPEMTTNVAGNSSCRCPKPCDQSIYSPVLSYAKLSTLNVDSILGNNIQPLLDQYYSALETRQRLEVKIFMSDIAMYQRLLTHSTELMSFIEKYTSGSQSMLSRIWDCGTALLTKALEPDIKLQFVNIESYSNVMQNVFGQSLGVHKNNGEVLYTKLEQLIVVTTTSLVEEGGRTAIMTLIQDAYVVHTIQHELTKTLRDLMASPANLTLTHGISPEHLPQTFYRDQASCEQSIFEYINILYALGSDLMRYGSPGVNYQEVIQNRLGLIQAAGEQVDNCFNEYTTVLQNIQSFITTTLHAIDKLIDRSNPISIANIKGINTFRNLQEEVTNGIMSYKSGDISKLQLLQNTFPEENPQKYATGTTNVVQGLRTNQLNAIKGYTDEIFLNSVISYFMLMSYTEDLSWYLSENSIYEGTSRLFIWKNPRVNFEYPMQIKDEGGELWEVWEDTESIVDFNDIVQHVLTGILDPYVNPILTEISDFGFQLTALETSIQSDLYAIDSEYKTYKELGELNSMFVQTNFLEADIYFRELKYQTVKQFRSYGLAQLFGDIGGYMGLLLGASALTVIELLDLIFYNGIRKLYGSRPNKDDDDESKTSEDKNRTQPKGFNNNGYENWNHGNEDLHDRTDSIKL